jgi:predicted PurR-regulated permease PerM
LLVTTLALQQFSSVISPVLLALVLVVGVHPLTGLLRRRGAPEWLAITCTLLVLVAIIHPHPHPNPQTLAQHGTVLPTYQDRFTAFLDDLEAWLATLGIGRDQLKAALGQISFGHLSGFFTDLLVGLAGAFSNLLLLLLIVLFMGLDATYFSRRLTRVGAERKAIVSALDGFAHGTRTYLVVSTIFGLVVAAIDTAFLWISGLFASGSSAQQPAGEPAEGSSVLSPDAPEVPVRRYRRSGTPPRTARPRGRVRGSSGSGTCSWLSPRRCLPSRRARGRAGASSGTS